MNELVVVRKLKKTFQKNGNKVRALAGVDLVVNKGDFIALQGPSGSGKKTLLNIIGCLDTPTSGRVLIDGLDVSKAGEGQLCQIRGDRIGFVFQSFNLMSILNAWENVALPLERKKMTRQEMEKRARQLLTKVGLKNRASHTPDEMSAGQQQRVAIARALANNPAMILADEPTGNLDSKSGGQIMKLLRKVNRTSGTTIVIVTHDDRMAKLANRIIHLEDGRIVNS